MVRKMIRAASRWKDQRKIQQPRHVAVRPHPRKADPIGSGFYGGSARSDRHASKGRPKEQRLKPGNEVWVASN